MTRQRADTRMRPRAKASLCTLASVAHLILNFLMSDIDKLSRTCYTARMKQEAARYPRKLTFRLSAEQADKLRDQAERMGVSPGVILRSLLRKWFNYQIEGKLIEEEDL